jgi:uncharacterized membrane protein YkoI
MNVKTKIGLGVVTAAVLAAAAVGVGYAFGDGDDDDVTGPAADQARAAAAQAVPGSTAGEVDNETGEGAAAYGVIVTNPDGTKLEVHLDKDFHFLGTEPAGHDNDGDH